MNQTVNYDNKKYNILKILHTRFSKVQSHQKQKEIIEKLYVSKRTFISWLYMPKNKQTEIRYSYLKKMSEILGVSVDELINYDI